MKTPPSPPRHLPMRINPRPCNVIRVQAHVLNCSLGVCVDVSDQVDGNGSFLLTADHLTAWERANGPLPNRSVILVNFSWAHRFGDRRRYYHDGTDGTSLRYLPYRWRETSKVCRRFVDPCRGTRFRAYA